MRTLRFLLQKEFRQIFRNTVILRMIIMLPIIQLLVMPLAADFEIKNINISIVDHDHSSYSRKLANKILASGYFKLNDFSGSFNESFKQFQGDKSDLILEIPKNFERDLVTENKGNLFIAVNAINGTKASVGSAYLGRIIAAYNSEIRLDWSEPQPIGIAVMLDIVPLNWFNPFLNYPFFLWCRVSWLYWLP